MCLNRVLHPPMLLWEALVRWLQCHLLLAIWLQQGQHRLLLQIQPLLLMHQPPLEMLAQQQCQRRPSHPILAACQASGAR